MPNLEDMAPEVQLRLMSYLTAMEGGKIFITATTFKGAHFGSRYPFSFTSPGCEVFSNINTTHNRSAAINYRDAVAEYILNNDGDIYAKVRDLNFANLTKFVKCLREKNKLDLFLDGTRTIVIHHQITKDFPDEPSRLRRWATFANTLVDVQAGKKLSTRHVVWRYENNSAMVQFLRVAGQNHWEEDNQWGLALQTLSCFVGESLQRSFVAAQQPGITTEQLDEIQFDEEYILMAEDSDEDSEEDSEEDEEGSEIDED